MAFVQRIVTNEKDPQREIIGLVTLEDVIEELIQSEIVDETDLIVDNRTKRKLSQHQNQDFSKFLEIRNCQKLVYISPQLAFATFQFLSTAVEPFHPSLVSEHILHRLLKKKNTIVKIHKSMSPTTLSPLIYESV